MRSSRIATTVRSILGKNACTHAVLDSGNHQVQLLGHQRSERGGAFRSILSSTGWRNQDPRGDEQAQVERLLYLLDQKTIRANPATFGRLLRACAKLKDLSEGKRVHAHIVGSGLEKDKFVANLLINMYGKCGSVEDAKRMFDKMPRRNVVSCTTMIAAYARHGRWGEALQLFRKMQLEGVKPNMVTCITALNALASPAALEDGRRIHAYISQNGFESNVFVGSALLSMYGKCGSLEDACRMFHKMQHRDVTSWNAMISACAQQGDGKKALQFFRQMQLEGVKLDRITFICTLSACASPGSLVDGKMIHSCVRESGLESDFALQNALVNMYGKCGSVEDARRMFDNMHQRSVITWTAMIAAYVQKGHIKEAARLFKQMQLEGVKPNSITLITILDTCSSPAALAEGKMIHTQIVEGGFESDAIVASALIHMYGKCGSVEDAKMVFNKMHGRDVVSWTAMIAAYAQQGHGKEALQLFQRMKLEGVQPNNITFITVLEACVGAAALAEGKMVHACAVESGVETDDVVGSALVTMYGRCGSVEDARRMFDKMKQRSVVTWTAMIGVYNQHDHGKEALQLFQQMQLEGVKPNSITFATVLNACAGLATLAEGKMIHAGIVESGFESEVVVGNALVDMYGKCGSVVDARRMFDKMHERDVVSWNSIIAAYAQNGHGKEAIHFFQLMQLEGLKPDETTFVHILSACSHAGLVDEGCGYFVSMSKDHGITAMNIHYGCMIDLFGRAGRLDEAEDLITKMPFQPDIVAWMTLLGACWNHGDVERGKRAAEHVLELDPQCAAAYRVLSNIYAMDGNWVDAEKVRKLMVDRGVKRNPGCSLIEINNTVHEFTAGDKSHPQMKEIYAELARLSRGMKKAGYVPNTKLVLQDVEEEKKEQSLLWHSEKLAIAFGLISTPHGTLLRIIKNLRMCSDCHTATNCISKLVEREIVVRDSYRFHHFKDGMCSCKNYW